MIVFVSEKMDPKNIPTTKELLEAADSFFKEYSAEIEQMLDNLSTQNYTPSGINNTDLN